MNSPRYAIGADIGGTKIAIGVVDDAGRILGSRSIATRSRTGFPDGLERMITAVREILVECNLTIAQLAGVGIGCAGPVDSLRGEIHNPHTLPGWNGAPIVSAFGERLDLPVWLENDADAAAFGECAFGAGVGADPVVMLTIGTGVGGAVIMRNEIVRGANGQHPEIGHLPILFDGPDCYCGRAGCLESLLSGTAIAAAGKRIGLADCRQVFIAAAGGDAGAAAILAQGTRALESVIWTLLHTYCPARIILGGGLVEAQPDFFNQASRLAGRNAQLIEKSAVAIVPARLGNQAGLIGAAAWALAQSSLCAHGAGSAAEMTSSS